MSISKFSLPIIISFSLCVNQNSFATSSLLVINRAKSTFDLSEALIKKPSQIVILKTDIDAMYAATHFFTGLSTGLIESADNSPWLFTNTIIKPEVINGIIDGGYSISTDKAGFKVCEAAKYYFGNNKLAVREIIINGIKNGPCEIFSSHHISLVFD